MLKEYILTQGIPKYEYFNNAFASHMYKREILCGSEQVAQL